MIDFMHRLLQKISRLMLLVILTTVFSPSFGWEAAEGLATHEHATMAGPEVDSNEHAAMDPHLAAAADCDGCPGHESAGCAETQHHCCPGHQLGHLQGGIADGLQLPLPISTASLSDNAASRFTSRVPEGLERPPRLLSA